ncbi:NADH dehydrogenase [Rhodovastum atsumiense]|uniref:NADH dehydrogenase n=1 Tax=Rhodovastum atsumiense TaxID=504468 RepID=A0A5M6IL05_9PROT|nr:complex I subunit 5 family protein [Rhodovastum atsumiense]KAA5608345.1 NADH dehydrogenase [Rhodovastum atsumiense]CAH2602341.1 NADH dehydrogenase [Rhodovastum atsumiense]
MTGTGLLLLATPLLPLALLPCCLMRRLRQGLPALLVLAPLPGLAAALLAGADTTLALDFPQLRMVLALDRPGAMLLGVSALLWSCAAAYATPWLGRTPQCGRFALFWLLTLAGNLGVFVAADLLGFYLAFALVSLAAYGLIVHDGTPGARRAGAITLALAILGEVFLLLAFVLLAQGTPGGSLLVSQTVAALPGAPWSTPALALLIAGFGLKAGLVPLHVWLPLAHPAAPTPASAVLSGAIIKTGIIGLIRFLPFAASPPGWGEALAAIGFVTAFYGAAIGLTQDNAKTVLAYSSVSQMGVIAAVLGLALQTGNGGALIAAAFYALHHALAKGALFMAVGIGARRAWLVLPLATVLALGLGGLPLTGGALAKLAIKPVLGDGVAGWLGDASAVATTVLMAHFLWVLVLAARRDPRALPLVEVQEAKPPGGVRGNAPALAWLVTAGLALVVPWALAPVVGPGDVWPVLLGGVLVLAHRRWWPRLPRIPAGDIVVFGESAVWRAVTWGAMVEGVERRLRAWPVAGLLLLAVMTVLGATLLVHP